ncbi:unnamed protein product [Miscanthus lutarioriparius]|uniref:DC1 domain-containing protein n=1 Tax=Miscanthus lutarioriparius TaxID=422564 RepID=A0A811Q9R7_9POAL|nr:unnamed protein product [Miscanthus lutarioriparius]
MCGTKKSVAYFAHDPAHRLLPAAVDGNDDGGDEFTCGGCLVAGAGPRYRCAHPGCGFTIHEACARRFPRTLRSAVHPQHRLRRWTSPPPSKPRGPPPTARAKATAEASVLAPQQLDQPCKRD